MVERPSLELDRIDSRLRPHQLQLIARTLNDLRSRLRADADPVDAATSPRTVPLVSAATRNPRACNASTRAGSSWSIGSPPVITTSRSLVHRPRVVRYVRQDGLNAANLPPPSPSVPTKSVSQKVHCAFARSCSRPDHRLHPAKRRKHRAAARLHALTLKGQEAFLDGVASCVDRRIFESRPPQSPWRAGGTRRTGRSGGRQAADRSNCG